MSVIGSDVSTKRQTFVYKGVHVFSTMLSRFSYSILFGLFLTFTHSTLAYATLSEDYYEHFKDANPPIANYGSLCEHIALKELASEYQGPQFEILNGVVYKKNSRTIGELDIVVIDRYRDEAVLVGEVKCWRNLNSALKKAREQLGRFSGTVETGETHQMHLLNDQSREFFLDQFDELPAYRTFAQKGSREEGFDYSLSLTYQEVRNLMRRLGRHRKATK